jgi:hypothetical protein
MPGSRKNHIFIGGEYFVWADETVHRKRSPDEIRVSDGQRERIEFVFAGNLTNDNVIPLKIRDDKRGPVFAACQIGERERQYDDIAS